VLLSIGKSLFNLLLPGFLLEQNLTVAELYFILDPLEFPEKILPELIVIDEVLALDNCLPHLEVFVIQNVSENLLAI
jgi:hypothetical protein